MFPSYSKVSLTAAQSHIYQKSLPHKFLSCDIAHLPESYYPTYEWYLHSKYVHTLVPNRTGCNRTPSLPRSNMYSPLFNKDLVNLVNSTSSSGCISIHSIPSVLQSLCKNVGLFDWVKSSQHKIWCHGSYQLLKKWDKVRCLSNLWYCLPIKSLQ